MCPEHDCRRCAGGYSMINGLRILLRQFPQVFRTTPTATVVKYWRRREGVWGRDSVAALGGGRRGSPDRALRRETRWLRSSIVDMAQESKTYVHRVQRGCAAWGGRGGCAAGGGGGCAACRGCAETRRLQGGMRVRCRSQCRPAGCCAFIGRLPGGQGSVRNVGMRPAGMYESFRLGCRRGWYRQ
jgi:hypothetical protein